MLLRSVNQYSDTFVKLIIRTMTAFSIAILSAITHASRSFSKIHKTIVWYNGGLQQYKMHGKMLHTFELVHQYTLHTSLQLQQRGRWWQRYLAHNKPHPYPPIIPIVYTYDCPHSLKDLAGGVIVKAPLAAPLALGDCKVRRGLAYANGLWFPHARCMHA